MSFSKVSAVSASSLTPHYPSRCSGCSCPRQRRSGRHVPGPGQPQESAAGLSHRGPGDLGMGPPSWQRPGLQSQGQPQCWGLPRQPWPDKHGQVLAAPGPLSVQCGVHTPGRLLRSQFALVSLCQQPGPHHQGQLRRSGQSGECLNQSKFLF